MPGVESVRQGKHCGRHHPKTVVTACNLQSEMKRCDLTSALSRKTHAIDMSAWWAMKAICCEVLEHFQGCCEGSVATRVAAVTRHDEILHHSCRQHAAVIIEDVKFSHAQPTVVVQPLPEILALILDHQANRQIGSCWIPLPLQARPRSVS